MNTTLQEENRKDVWRLHRTDPSTESKSKGPDTTLFKVSGPFLIEKMGLRSSSSQTSPCRTV